MANPARSTWTTRVAVEGRPEVPDGEQDEAQFRTADPDYLGVARAALLRGRFFQENDDAQHPLVSVVNEAFVRRHFPGEDPVGEKIRVYGSARQIVGIVSDLRYDGPREEAQPTMYFPFQQAPFPYLTLVVRTTGDPVALHERLRQTALEAEPGAAPYAIETLEQTVAEATARDRFIMALLSTFAGLALLLAAVGIYGVVAFTVGRRLKEMAIRICFGAGAGDVFWTLVSGTLGRTVLGVSAGGLLAWLAKGFLEPLLFRTSATDAATYAAVGAVFLAVALAGAAAPALRAMRLRGAEALRQE
jgi:putative ABC transport system permease protein